MPKYTRVIFYDMSPFHIGRGTDFYDLSAEEISSDMLSSSLAAIRAELGKSEDIESFLQSFALSSAFPYVKEHFFLPRLAGRVNVYIQHLDEAVYRKQLKHVRFIEDEFWFRLTSSTDAVAISREQICDSFLLSSPTLNFKSPIVKATMQRVKVPNDETLDSQPFYFQWNFVKPDCGLYCLLECEPEREKEIIQLFQLLGNRGFGSDKNVGGGHFKVRTEEVNFPSLQDANAQVSLSTFIPTKDETEKLNLPLSTFELKKIGGFMAGSNVEAFRHLHRKSVFAFRTGSVFMTTEKFTGKVVDLAPAWNDAQMHPVWRSGRALTVNIKQ